MTPYDWPAEAADLLQRRPDLGGIGWSGAVLDAVVGEQVRAVVEVGEAGAEVRRG